jgi:hypothetical protein
LFRKLFRKQVYALLIHDYEDPLSGHIPVDLEEGANANLSFRFSNGTFLEENFNQVGVSDPFGKVHWCSKKNFQYAQKTYKEQKVEMSSEEHPSA